MRGVLRRHQDSALALVVLAAGPVGGAGMRHEVLPECLVALLVAGAVAVRRRWPLISLAGVQTLGVAVTALQLVPADTAGFVLGYLVLVYTAAAARPIRAALAGMAFSLVAFWCEDVMLGHHAIEYVFSAVFVVTPWAVGRYVRRERELRGALLAALDAERTALARAAVAEERQRIAQDMHQIVTHGLSAIAVQSGAAEAALSSDPRRGREPVREINLIARHCVAEMRVLLTVLRSGGTAGESTVPSGPVPGARALRFGVVAQLWSARDWVFAGAVLAVGLAAAPGASRDRIFAAAIAAAVAAPVAARRRGALASLACEAVVVVAVTAVRPQPALGGAYALASLLLLFTVGMRRDRASLVGLGIGLAAYWSVDAMSDHPPSGYLASAVIAGGVWLVGAIIGRVRELRTQVTAATAAERRALAAEAAADERRRLAREMHDVVAHGLSAIAVQSSAADAALDVDAARALAAVRTVASLAEQCAAEMRQLLDVLGAAGISDPVAGTDLRAVLTAQESLGLAVQASIDDGVLDTQTPVVALAAARIVQEALTNVRRHSRSTTARVEIRRLGDSVRLTVSDPGPPRVPASGPAGHGTTGMRERAAALGGQCEVGPHQVGWRVDVLLPPCVTTPPALVLRTEPA